MMPRRLILLALAMLAALVLAAPAEAVPPPQSDPFYQPPNPLPDVPPGTTLRSREVDITAVGVPLPYRAWQVLYTTRDTQNNPEATVATIIEPQGARPAGGRPLLSYQAAEDALTQTCAPSYTLQQGTEKEEPQVLQALDRGWAVVVPDFEGPQSQWTAGYQEGRATLDAIRAAQRFAPVGLAGAQTPVGMWGYSGGGHASAWAAELQPGYAPELNLKGVAYGGVAAYIEQTLRNLDGGPYAGITFGGVVGVSRAHPEFDLQSYLNPAGKAMVADVGKGCIQDWIVPYAFRKLSEYTTVPDPIGLPGVKKLMADESLGQRRPGGSHYVYWAINDQLNPISEGDKLVDTYCRQGVAIDYVRDPASEHISLAVSGTPGALSFLADRFAGKPFANRCAKSAAPSPSARRCLSRTSPIGPRNIGRIRLGLTRRRLAKINVKAARRTRLTQVYCVKRSRRRVVAVFSSTRASGRVRLVTTTATGHHMRRVGPGVGARRLARRFPARRRLSRSLFRAGPTSRRLFGVRHAKVRYVAVADKPLLRHRASLRRNLRRAGL